MERLSGLDASFLYMETPTLHMHVSMAAVFDPSTIKGGYSFERVHKLVSGRLAKVPVFRRRLVQVPFRLGHPYWVDDPAFDLDFHLRRAALPSPGGMAELAEFVGDVCSRQLDRSKPLWQMYIVEGLENGNFALVTKMHHSTIDGVSGAELLAQLFDLSSDPAPAADERPELMRSRIPSDMTLVAQALATRLTKPPRIARLAWKTAFAILDVRKVRSSESTRGKAALPLTAPRTSFNAAITAHRKVSFSSISLDDVKRLKNALGITVNDVVLAVCTGALRNYLESRGELPESPLVATVPVSVQGIQGVQSSNHISAMFVNLPTHLEDPLERLKTIREGTKGAKEEHHALGAEVLLNWVEHATPTVFAAAARTYSRLKLADRHRPIHNLIVSNVPGPDFPLYFSGAELVAGFPLGPILDGAGLNITVMSYRGVLNWGLMACRETVAGADEIAEAIPAALDELLVAAGLGHAVPTGIAPGPDMGSAVEVSQAGAEAAMPYAERSAPAKTRLAKSRPAKSRPAKSRPSKSNGTSPSAKRSTHPSEEAAMPTDKTAKDSGREDSDESLVVVTEVQTDPVEELIGEDAPQEREVPEHRTIGRPLSESELIVELLEAPGQEDMEPADLKPANRD
jgi:diacylglycerol O-acyltransferase / wax synthase